MARRVLVLSGWSDGPLPGVVRDLEMRHSCRCEVVPLQMPPRGWRWCLNPFVPLLLGLLPATIVGCERVVAVLAPGTAIVLCVVIVGAALLLARLLVAAIVRYAVRRGVAATKARMRRDVALIVGFSWGGGVAHHVLARHAPDCPVLLLAPTSIAMANVARSKPPPFRGSRVTVVTATYDDFCPPATPRLYEALGCTVHQVDDNHVLLNTSSQSVIVQALAGLLSNSPEEPTSQASRRPSS